MFEADLQLVRGALARNPDACRQLVTRLSPVIQKRVNAAFIRGRRGSRQEVVDLTQEIFRILLDHDGRVLRGWDPARGATLEGYVSIVAERKVASIMVSGRKSGWAEDAVEADILDALDGELPSPEEITASREVLGRLLDRLRTTLSPRAYEMFVWLFVDERDVAWIATASGLHRDAVYAWRSRLQKVINKEASEISSDGEASSGTRRSGVSG